MGAHVSPQGAWCTWSLGIIVFKSRSKTPPRMPSKDDSRSSKPDAPQATRDSVSADTISLCPSRVLEHPAQQAEEHDFPRTTSRKSNRLCAHYTSDAMCSIDISRTLCCLYMSRSDPFESRHKKPIFTCLCVETAAAIAVATTVRVTTAVAATTTANGHSVGA